MKIGTLTQIRQNAITPTSDLAGISAKLQKTRTEVGKELIDAVKQKKESDNQLMRSVFVNPISETLEALKKVCVVSMERIKSSKAVAAVNQAEIKDLKEEKKILKGTEKAVKGAYKQRGAFTNADNARIEAENLTYAEGKKERLDLAHTFRESYYQTQDEVNGIRAEKAQLQARLKDLSVQEKVKTKGMEELDKMAKEATTNIDE